MTATRTKPILHQNEKDRRDLMRTQKICINGPEIGSTRKNRVVHGAVVRGGKCQRCIDVHKGKKVPS